MLPAAVFRCDSSIDWGTFAFTKAGSCVDVSACRLAELARPAGGFRVQDAMEIPQWNETGNDSLDS